MAEVEQSLKRIQQFNGVIGTIAVNPEGIPIKSNLDTASTLQYVNLANQLVAKATLTVRDIDPQNELTFLRIKTKRHEIMVGPENGYMLITIQNPIS